ncbi:MAG: hypothetical protein ACKVOM_05390 [Ferruginibacter sp.]
MEYILFVTYFCALCFAATKIKFIETAGLGTKTVIGLFCIKIAAGMAVWMVSHYLFNDLTDYYSTNNYGIQEYQSLIHTPKIFFTDLFISPYNEKSEFFGSKVSYWNDLRYNIIYKVLAFTNILAQGNYYINSLFFNFVAFLGTVALYRVFINVYPAKKWAVIVGCFLLPSTLFYSSGIHKDLIVFTSICIFCYCIFFGLQKGFNAKKTCILLLSFITILFIRNFIAVILLPCALAWFVSKKYSLRPLKVFGLLFIVGLAATAFAHNFYKKADPLLMVVEKQQAFLALGNGNTSYHMDTLQPTFKSFITSAPAALRHSFLSPLPGEFNNVFTNLLSVEIIVYWLLFLLMLIFKLKNILQQNEFIFFGVLFTFLIFLFTGYITTTAGALVRYRSIYLPFLITPLLCSIDWQKIYVNLTSSNRFTVSKS